MKFGSISLAVFCIPLALAEPILAGMAQDPAVTAKKADEVVQKTNELCTDLSADCKASMTRLVVELKNGAMGQDPVAAQEPARKFAEELKKQGACIEPMMKCVKKLQDSGITG